MFCIKKKRKEMEYIYNKKYCKQFPKPYKTSEIDSAHMHCIQMLTNAFTFFTALTDVRSPRSY